MTAPIPLAAPDGLTLEYAACPDPCRACRGWATDGRLCDECLRDARRALEALACLGMAVAVAQHASARVSAVLGGRRMLPERERLRDEALAALCGVDAETVCGWRR